MKKPKKTKRYEATPVSLTVPLTLEPVIERKTNKKGDAIKPDLKNLKYASASSPTLRLDIITNQTKEKLSACSRFIDTRNFAKFYEITTKHPELLEDKWVHAQAQLYRNRSRTMRGRPTGTYTIPPALVLGFVKAARSTKQVANQDEAFILISNFMGVSYDVIKRLYYTASNLSSNAAIMVETGPARDVTEAEKDMLDALRNNN